MCRFISQLRKICETIRPPVRGQTSLDDSSQVRTVEWLILNRNDWRDRPWAVKMCNTQYIHTHTHTHTCTSTHTRTHAIHMQRGTGISREYQSKKKSNQCTTTRNLDTQSQSQSQSQTVALFLQPIGICLEPKYLVPLRVELQQAVVVAIFTEQLVDRSRLLQGQGYCCR